MARRQQETLYRVREGFAVPGDGGVLRAYQIGDLLHADDPLAKSHAALLEPATEYATGRSDEEARAALRLPGGRTVEGATAHQGSHAERTTEDIEDRRRRGEDVPRRDAIPTSDPRNPASEFAPLQPGLGVVAPDVTESQNPAGAPGPDDDEVADAVAAQAYDPADYKVEEVNAYLDTVGEEERERVLQAERDGKNRTGIVG